MARLKLVARASADAAWPSHSCATDLRRPNRGGERAGLAGLRVHDLRHTVGLRLREAGVPENTVADILWHQRAGSTMTAHYSQAQVLERRNALELIAKDSGQFNKSIRTLIADARAAKAAAASVKQAAKLRVVGGLEAVARSSRKVPARSSSGDIANASEKGNTVTNAGLSPRKVPAQRKRA
jgi:hypothetical protein